MKRARRLLAWFAGIGALAASLAGATSEPFDYAALVARARTMAAKPYAPPQGEVPEWLRKLSYDELRQIEFDGRESLWFRERLPFQVQYLHPGFLYNQTVHLAELRG